MTPARRTGCRELKPSFYSALTTSNRVAVRADFEQHDVVPLPHNQSYALPDCEVRQQKASTGQAHWEPASKYFGEVDACPVAGCAFFENCLAAILEWSMLEGMLVNLIVCHLHEQSQHRPIGALKKILH